MAAPKTKKKQTGGVRKNYNKINYNNNNDLYSANSIQCSNALYNKITQSKKSDTIINTTIRIK